MKKLFPSLCLVLWFLGGFAPSAEAQLVFSLRIVKILDSSFAEKSCPSCGAGGTSEIPLGEAVPGDSFVIEAFASGWDRFADRALCEGGQRCSLSSPFCPDSHCSDTGNACTSTANCNPGARCDADTCTPDPLIGAFQFTLNSETWQNGFPGGFQIPQLPCDDLACDDDPFFEGCSCFHGIPFPDSLCTCFITPPDLSCIPGVCAGGPNEGSPCTSALDCEVCVGGDLDGSPCSRDGDCLGGGLCQASGETCEDFFRCWKGASAFIDLSRADYLLGAFASIDAVDISSDDVAFLGALQQVGDVAEKLGCGGDAGSPCTTRGDCQFCVGGPITGATCSLATDCAACVGGDNVGQVCVTSLDCPGSICNDTGTCPATGVTCDRIPSYMGTIILQSAACSGGTYSIDFINDDELTFMNDDDSAKLPAPRLEPAVINFPSVADPCATVMCDNSDLCNPEACVNAGPDGDLCGGPSCEVTPVLCPPGQACNPANGICSDVVGEMCTLTATSVACDSSLPRNQKNILTLTFDCQGGALPPPGSGDIQIRELLDGGAFDAVDLAGSFDISAIGNEVTIKEIGGVLINEVWYGITGAWSTTTVTVDPFKMDYAAVFGDATDDLQTDVTDVARVLANRGDPDPTFSRSDINGDGFVDVTDVGNTLAARNSAAPTKPTGHTCTLP